MKRAYIKFLCQGLLAATGVLCAHAEEPFNPASLKKFTDGAPYLEKFETGLYPGGKNEIPEAHRKSGERMAASITPLNSDGKPNPDGKIVALVMGHSNCLLYFGNLEEHLKQHAQELNPKYELLNAAVGGNQLPEIRYFKSPVWKKAESLLARPGYSPLQVQVLFLHTTYNGAVNSSHAPPRSFPEDMKKMQGDLAAVLENCVKIYPNLKIAYLTSDGFRHYTGFEPHVWQEAFAFKWLIESQIKAEDGTAFEGEKRKLPWLQWGPYIWDNSWDQSYFRDGVHPTPKTREIFVGKYWNFLNQDPVSRAWLLKTSSHK